jgi:4-deoxy-L-threo-5-hexosulose-uronate ketol-isomerase
MKMLEMADPFRYSRMTTEELRNIFLLTDLFQPGSVNLTYVDLDRTIIGSAVPVGAPMNLPCDEMLKAAYFTERRELGVLNIGGPGRVNVGSSEFNLGNLDGLYIGRGNDHVEFHSADPAQAAEFYLLSYPAHAVYPSQLVRSADLPRTALGSPQSANQRNIVRMIHLNGVRSCQLVMGFTQLATGSVWNTMPPHTHRRRSEVYLYFNLPANERVVHLMGPAHETRSLIMANKQVVVSPGWSIHAGVGTSNYTFCWGMGGENQDYGDMDHLAVKDFL